jgi:dethiobiotin synthetase
MSDKPKRPAACFVTGTDTDVGKTVIGAGLLAAANARGLTTAAVKPVAAGCEPTPAGLRNGDALLLQRTASLELDYDEVNPVALAPAIAPHIAARQSGRRLTISQLAGLCRGVLMHRADLTLIEGAGGWRVPLSERELLSQLPRELNLPVVLVVGMRLGCISHALLTAEAIARDGLRIAGWVANSCVAGMSCYQENLATLRDLLAAPLLGEVPHLLAPEPEAVARHLDIEPLLLPPVS